MSHALRHVAPLLLMCEPSDLHVVPQVKSTHDEKPVIYLYDRYPGGVGLSDKAYSHLEEFIQSCLKLITMCPCNSGCPSCVGNDEGAGNTKELVVTLIRTILK